MNKVKKIEICFPCEVELPDGWEYTLDAMVRMVCEKYQAANPDMVMWPAGYGSKPIFNGSSNEPWFDDNVYQIEVMVREDDHGHNPYNPNRDELRAKASEERARALRRKKETQRILNE